MADTTTNRLNLLTAPSSYQVPLLQYPEDLGSSKRSHVVQFFINEVDYSKLSQGVNSSNDGSQYVGIYGPTSNPNSGPFTIRISPPTKRTGTVISLYMPDTINVSYDYGYQEDNLSDYAVAYYGEALGSYFSPQGKKQVSDWFSLSSSPELLAAVRNLAGNLVPIDTILKGRGYAINPQVQLLFRSVALRTFQFDFLFTPYNQTESDSVKRIIQAFKSAAAPQIGGGATGSGLFFKIPNTFNIGFYSGGSENTNVHKISECVLESINVDYAPNGWAAFQDTNAPVQTRLTMQFKELNIMDKSQIDAGY